MCRNSYQQHLSFTMLQTVKAVDDICWTQCLGNRYLYKNRQDVAHSGGYGQQHFLKSKLLLAERETCCFSLNHEVEMSTVFARSKFT